MWIFIEKLMRRYGRYLPWQFKYLFGKAGIGGMDFSIDRHFEYAFTVNRLKNNNGGVLVDIGGAGSLLTPILVGLGYKVIGYDLYNWSLKYPGYEHYVGDACKMAFDNSSIDACVSISCIEHLAVTRYGENVKRLDKELMREVLRVLRPGGKCIISLPYGPARINTAQRVYDESAIKALTEGFKEVSREIYIPRDDEGLYHYRLGKKEEAMADRPWFRYSVIALEMEKT